MSKWSLLLCEGAHDQKFLCCLAEAGGKWKRSLEEPGIVPHGFGRGTNATYLFLVNNQDDAIVIASMNGVQHIIPVEKDGGKAGGLLAKSAASAHAIGVMFDADDVGAENRRDIARKHYQPVIPSAAHAEHARFVAASASQADQRAFGLWIAPDGASNGTLDSLIHRAASQRHPALVPICDAFIDNLGKTAPHDWKHVRYKAILGSLGQLWKAGGSLASAFDEKEKWMTPEIAAQAPFSRLLAFLDAAVA